LSPRLASSLALAAPLALAAAAAGYLAFSLGSSSEPARTVRAAAPTLARKPTRPGPGPAVANVTFSPRSSLARLDLRTGAVRRLALGRFFSVADPRLSGSGRLAFIGSRCANCPQRLTVVRAGRAAPSVRAVSAAWTKQGKLLISAGRGEETEIRLVGANGHGQELEWLTRAGERMAVETEKELTLSPDGRTLLFSGEGSAEHHGNYIVDLRGQRLLPLAGEADDAPSFSPDGRTIAYQQVSRMGDWDLCLAVISHWAASHRHCRRSPGGNERQPVFLPNGHQLVFASDRGSRSAVSRLYLLDLRTGTVRRLTPATYDATSPTIAPDGQSLVFVRRALIPLH
jgi:dipeptidyl aminopeptidase/acylaminoacyl peptidase